MDKQYAIVYKKGKKYTVYKAAPNLERIALLLIEGKDFLSKFKKVEIVELIAAEGDDKLK